MPDRRCALSDRPHARRRSLSSTAVEASATLAAAAALVNALLRRYLRERDALDAAADPVALWSHPGWWIRRVQRRWPDDWETVLAAGNERPPRARG
jgi:16S rRNA (cytosine967-C5)-methyltransferase